MTSIEQLSEQMAAAAAGWRPERMPDAIAGLEEIGPTMRNLGQALSILAARTGQEWPLHPAITGLTTAIVGAQGRVADAADQIPPAIRMLHAAELGRFTAPRPGEQAWDVAGGAGLPGGQLAAELDDAQAAVTAAASTKDDPMTEPDIGPGGLFLGGVNDGEVGWYDKGLAGGRTLSVTDGELNTAGVGLTRPQTHQLRDAIAATLAGDADAPARLTAGNGAISWQPDGAGYRMRVEDGDQAVEVPLTGAQLRAIGRQLTEDLAAEAAAAATFPGVTGRLEDKPAGVSLDNDAQLQLPDGALPDDQAAACGRAVRLYRNSTYRQIAAYLRGGEADDKILPIRETRGQTDPSLEAVSAHVALIDQALRAAPLTQETTVWRGVRALHTVLGAEALADDLTGATWTEHSYPSTSLLPGVASIFADEDLLLRLRLPAGVGAIQLDSLPTDREHNREAELLLERGLTMRVVADQHEDIERGSGTRRYRVLDVEVDAPDDRPLDRREDSPVTSPVTGDYSTTAPMPNRWGSHSANDYPIVFHADGQIGQAIQNMGRDAAMDVDGQPLADVLGRLATDAVAGRRGSQQVVDEIEALLPRLPEDSAARRWLAVAVSELDAPDTPVPALPADTRAPLRQLVEDLHAVPLVRREPDRELAPVLDFIAQVAGQPLSLSGVRRLRQLANRRHESREGKFEIDRAIMRAKNALEALYRAEHR